MRADFKNTKAGDRIKFVKAGPHWFRNRAENGEKLNAGDVFTVKKINVASSSTEVILEETGLGYELGWFDHLEQYMKPQNPNEYSPDKWVVVKIEGGEFPLTYKVFGNWHGGYMDSGGSWKLNSGITRVTKAKKHYNFRGFSGSVYQCHENAYGMTGYGATVIDSIIKRSKEAGVDVEILSDDTNWLELKYEN